jgi:hypothetical protein
MTRRNKFPLHRTTLIISPEWKTEWNLEMAIFSVYIINKAGGLIYQYDHSQNRPELEKTFAFPLSLVLKIYDDKVVVAFGEVDGIKGKRRRGEKR